MKQYGRKREKPHLATLAAARPLLGPAPAMSTLPATPSPKNQALASPPAPPLPPATRLLSILLNAQIEDGDTSCRLQPPCPALLRPLALSHTCHSTTMELPVDTIALVASSSWEPTVINGFSFSPHIVHHPRRATPATRTSRLLPLCSSRPRQLLHRVWALSASAPVRCLRSCGAGSLVCVTACCRITPPRHWIPPSRPPLPPVPVSPLWDLPPPLLVAVV
jgi:hypothetical protein